MRAKEFSFAPSFYLPQYFASPDELANFCMMDVDGQAAKLLELAAQGRIPGHMQCTILEVSL
jgi:hypothetical protein